MSAKKTAKPKAPKAKRPPRQVWILFARDGRAASVVGTRKHASDVEDVTNWTVAGPYVLAERVRQP